MPGLIWVQGHKQVHFLQIWIEPSAKGIKPGYEEKHFDVASKEGQLRLIASQDGSEGSVTIHQDARLYASILQNDASIVHPLAPGRTAYVHLIRGQMTVNGQRLVTGDALKITGENNVTVDQTEAAEFLLFDLPY